MTRKRIFSLLLCFAMIFSFFPVNSVFADESQQKDWRTIYLHAQGENPQETVDLSTVYLNETADIYFAVDNPNKGKYENGKHLEPQYDMNGYTIKIHFDSAYFDYDQDSSSPIVYTVPGTNLSESESDSFEVSGKPVENVPQQAGYYVFSHGGDLEIADGIVYKTAYITVFFNGGYVPQKRDNQLWYNLCKLPLKPLKTGSSDVFVDVYRGDVHDVELFAKNIDGDLNKQTFNFDARNNGRHTLVIKNKLRPDAPKATPNPGNYTEKQVVNLSAESDCDIYYSIDGGNTYELYAGEISVETSTIIQAYAKRKSDGKVSDTVRFTYNILPKVPYLFFDNKTEKLPNIYKESDDVFTVYVSDKDIYDDIDPENEVYYTFSNLDTTEITYEGGTDPETEWVKIPRGSDVQKILITENCTVRIVTSRLGELSDVNTYYLGIRPAKVTAEDNPPAPYINKVDVTLKCETQGAKIYYTTDGSSPITNGIEYNYTIPLSKDTTIKAVAKVGDVYGEISSFHYVFEAPSNYGVDAFYPAGVYEGNVLVTLTPYDPHNKVMYSDDEGQTWKEYSAVLDIDKDTTIMAKSVDKDGNEGDVYTFKYMIKPLPPEFSPETTHFSNSNNVTIFCPESTAENTDRFELWYTYGSSDPADPRDTTKSIKADHPLDTQVIPIDGYTIIKAAVRKDGHAWSEVVTHSYDLVVDKPTKPITTLIPGNYQRELDNEDGFSTGFLPVASNTEIYYTVGKNGQVPADPDPKNMPATKTEKYDGTPIVIEGNTIIKAVAVNDYGVKSDIGIFEYTIIPAPPKIPGSAISPEEKYAIVEVEVIPGSEITYIINGNENSFEYDGDVFYIDPNTGNAYSSPDCNEDNLLGTGINMQSSDEVNLEIWKTLHEVDSASSHATFEKTADINYLNAPLADKVSGNYYEMNVDGNNNFLVITLSSPYNKGDTIQYTFDDPNLDKWNDYNGTPLKINKNMPSKESNSVELSVRAKKGEYFSDVVTYYYYFKPLPPVITRASGTYPADPVQYTYIELDDRAPTNVSYEIYYRANGDPKDYLYRGNQIEIEHSMSVRAYVVNTEKNKYNVSDDATRSYMIESTSSVNGVVNIASPYNVKRIASNHLNTGAFAEGIKLISTNNNATIRYFYGYKTRDGKDVATNIMTYQNVPIMVNSNMESITVYAWLEDSTGTIIAESGDKFPWTIEFVDLGVPVTSLGDSAVQQPLNTLYKLEDYPHKEFPEAILFYTLNGDDPTDPNSSRIVYKGEELKITEAVTTVKAVYFLPCGGTCERCKNGHPENCIEIYNSYSYGAVGTYRYTIPSSGGGGGGGGGGRKTIDNTRRYTSDIFKNEHPTHIGYIKGYPDGSVQPDGNITREEMAAILYRIKNKEYDAPFTTTGEVFPDVEKTRWSVTEIEYMTNDEVIIGYPDGEFKPQNNLTRAEFAALIKRFAKLKDATPKKDVFPDLEEEHWAYADVHALYAAKLLDGYEDGTFRAENQITRAEVMTVVNKLLGRNPSESYVKSLKFNPFNDLLEEKWYYVIVLEATITHNYYLDARDVEIKWEDFK